MSTSGSVTAANVHASISHKARRALAPYPYQALTIIFLAMLMVVPIITVVRYSLLDNAIMSRHPSFVGLQNYLTVLTDDTFWTAVTNTLYFTVLSVVFHLLIGMCFALLLNSPVINPVIRSILRVFFIMPWVFTATIIAIIWRLLLDPLGIINYVLQAVDLMKGNHGWFSSPEAAMQALVFVNIWAGYPFYMVSLLAGLQGIPNELYEAATIDGANEPQKFRHITVPQLMPIILSIAMLDFIWTMQIFALVWMTTGGGPIHATEVLGTFTYKLAFSTYRFSVASASAVVILLLSMSVAFFYVRQQRARG